MTVGEWSHLSYVAFVAHDGHRRSHKVADDIFRLGIKRNARPLERLKKRYAEFQARPSSSSSRPAPSTSHPEGNTQSDILRHDPLKNYNILPQSRNTRPKGTNTKPTIHASESPPRTGPAGGSGVYDPYAYITAPPSAGRRPAKLRFDLSLLYTEEGGEYSYQEARAKSMGLLGKKWGPDPISALSSSTSSIDSASSSSSSIAVDFNDDDHKTIVPNRRQSRVGFEPTVTINTKEALADVFGMYNSPEKTLKIERPGSKHAPVKKVEPVTPAPLVKPLAREVGGDENAFQPAVKTPGRCLLLTNFRVSLIASSVAFKPFVDENANRKENATPAPKVNNQSYAGDSDTDKAASSSHLLTRTHPTRHPSSLQTSTDVYYPPRTQQPQPRPLHLLPDRNSAKNPSWGCYSLSRKMAPTRVYFPRSSRQKDHLRMYSQMTRVSKSRVHPILKSSPCSRHLAWRLHRRSYPHRIRMRRHPSKSLAVLLVRARTLSHRNQASSRSLLMTVLVKSLRRRL